MRSYEFHWAIAIVLGTACLFHLLSKTAGVDREVARMQAAKDLQQRLLRNRERLREQNRARYGRSFTGPESEPDPIEEPPTTAPPAGVIDPWEGFPPPVVARR